MTGGWDNPFVDLSKRAFSRCFLLFWTRTNILSVPPEQSWVGRLSWCGNGSLPAPPCRGGGWGLTVGSLYAGGQLVFPRGCLTRLWWRHSVWTLSVSRGLRLAFNTNTDIRIVLESIRRLLPPPTSSSPPHRTRSPLFPRPLSSFLSLFPSFDVRLLSPP